MKRRNRKKWLTAWETWVNGLKPSERAKYFGYHYGEHGALTMYGIPKRPI